MGNTPLRPLRRGRFYHKLQEDRAKGRQELKSMAANRQLNEIDWDAVVQKADQLHREEQRNLRKLERGKKRWRRRQQRRSRHLRRKFGAAAAGVYSVNLLSINNKQNTCLYDEEFDDSYSVYYTMVATSDRDSRASKNTAEAGSRQQQPVSSRRIHPGSSSMPKTETTAATKTLTKTSSKGGEPMLTVRATTGLSTLTEEPSSSGEDALAFQAESGRYLIAF